MIDGTYRSVERTRGKKIYFKQEPPCLPSRRSSGLFVAVQPGSDSIVDAIGLGWMFRFPDKLQLLGNRTLNVGFGVVGDQNVQVLGKGFVADEPPPMGASNTPETQVRYRTTAQSGIFAMASIELGQTPAQIPRRSLTFYAGSPPGNATLKVGDSVTLYWAIDEMDSCTASDAWMGEKKIRGEEQVALGTAGHKTFTLECTGTNRTAKKFVEVDVAEATAGAE